MHKIGVLKRSRPEDDRGGGPGLRKEGPRNELQSGTSTSGRVQMMSQPVGKQARPQTHIHSTHPYHPLIRHISSQLGNNLAPSREKYLVGGQRSVRKYAVIAVQMLILVVLPTLESDILADLYS